MKALLTILFFADTLLLAVLTFRLLKVMDSGTHGWPVVALLLGIVISILLLVFFFYRYLRLPSRKS